MSVFLLPPPVLFNRTLFSADVHMQDTTRNCQIDNIQTRRAQDEFLQRLEQLDRTLKDVKLQHDNLSINRIVPVSSSESVLPNEILADIFEECHALRMMYYPSYDPPVEITISHVSRRWRGVAINTSRLWTKIRILLSTKQDLIDTYLHRSNESRLDLLLYIKSQFPPFSQILAPVYTAVISAAHRWERISVQSEEFYLLDQWFDALPPTAPLLTSIEVELDEIGSYPNDTGRRIFPGGAASLTSVSVMGIGLHHCCPPLALLNHLHIHTVPEIMWTSYEEIGAMINVSSMLTHLTIHGDIFESTLPTSWTPVELPSLRVLDLSYFVGTADLIGFLTIASAPVLKHLILQSITYDELESLLRSSSLATFTGQSPLLDCVTIRTAARYSSFMWMELGYAFPTTSQLTMIECDPRPFFAGLDPAEGDPLSWPRLRTISIACVTQEGITECCKTLTARIAVNRPIEKLRLLSDVFRGGNPSSWRHLQELTQVENFEPDMLNL